MTAADRERLDPDRVREFEPRRFALLWLMAVIELGMAAAGVVAVVGGESTGWVLVVSGTVLAAMRVALNRRVVKRPGLRIDPTGVTWLDSNHHLDWSRINSIRVVRTSPLWRLLDVWPQVQLVDHAQAAFAARANYTPVAHVIDLRWLQADADQVMSAIAAQRP